MCTSTAQVRMCHRTSLRGGLALSQLELTVCLRYMPVFSHRTPEAARKFQRRKKKTQPGSVEAATHSGKDEEKFDDSDSLSLLLSITLILTPAPCQGCCREDYRMQKTSAASDLVF